MLERKIKKAKRAVISKEKTKWLKIIIKTIRDSFRKTEDKRILFIVGCQRSGTSLLQDIFERDLNTKVFYETSKLTQKRPERFRLKSYDTIKIILDHENAPFIIIKPLVESQNIISLLEFFLNSKAIWVYRNYKDVALSDIKRFGLKNGIENIKPIVEGNTNNWRSEKVSMDTMKLITKFYSPNMNEYDAAVLFWYARNMIFFDQSLQKKNDILLFKYEHLIQFPEESIKIIYQFNQQQYPGSKIHDQIHGKSINKGNNITISPAIEKLAENLQNKLDNIFYNKQKL